MSSRSVQRESKSIKTFFIYTGIVLFFIIVSLGIKSFILIQNSRFDPNNQFILSIAHKDKIQEIALFHPAERSVTLLELQGEPVTLSSIEKTLGVIPDAYVTSPFSLPLGDIKETTRVIAFKYYSLKTNLTLFDVLSLSFTSQKLSLNNEQEKKVTIIKDVEENDQNLKNLFINDKIFAENVSVQIINSSSVPGMGKRLERVLTKLGSNVISLSSSREQEKKSKIQYFGEESYTLSTLKKLLAFPVEKTENKSIATIVIIIGDDIKNSSYFK